MRTALPYPDVAERRDGATMQGQDHGLVCQPAASAEPARSRPWVPRYGLYQREPQA